MTSIADFVEIDKRVIAPFGPGLWRTVYLPREYGDGDGDLDVHPRQAVEIEPSRADQRVAQLRATHAGDAVIAKRAEAARRRGFAGAAIKLQFQAGAAEKELLRGLAERLGVIKSVVERYFGALAKRSEAVEVELG